MEGTKVIKKERNHYIDTLKGLAIISVIFIHTCFLDGGATYVPQWFVNLTLLFEVPIFFFLSGWSFSYTRDNKSYVKSLILTQIRYMVFISIIVLILNLINYIQSGTYNIGLSRFIQFIFHAEITTEPLNGICYDLWFFRVYFIVCIIGAILLRLLNQKASKILVILLGAMVFLCTFIFPEIGKLNLGMEYSYIFFYLFFFMLGNITKDTSLKLRDTIISVVSLVVSLVCIKMFLPIDIFDLQSNKFPPNFVFLIWSLFGVVIVLYLKNFFWNCKDNIISKIGKYSIYIYLAQSVSKSILAIILPIVTSNIIIAWPIMMIIAFIVNLIMSGIFTVLLKVITEPIVKICKNFLNNKVYAKECN